VLNIELCEKILNKKEKKFSRKQIEKIRELLYLLAAIEFDNHQKIKYEKRNNLC
jgi:hypothetical protein